MPSDETQNKSGIESLEATNHPFVIRIWLEESAEGGHRAAWRGHITHVPSGVRCYLQHLDDIPAFIAPYLEEMGITVSPQPSLKEHLRRLRTRLSWPFHSFEEKD